MESNIKYITISDFHDQVDRFCSENSVDVCDNGIIIKMIQKGYSFANISPSRRKEALAELRIVATDGKHAESLSIINSFLKRCPYCEKREEEEEEEYNMDSESE
jgi:hypothetical protein